MSAWSLESSRVGDERQRDVGGALTDLIRVAAELVDIGLDPFKRFALVEEARVLLTRGDFRGV